MTVRSKRDSTRLIMREEGRREGGKERRREGEKEERREEERERESRKGFAY